MAFPKLTLRPRLSSCDAQTAKAFHFENVLGTRENRSKWNLRNHLHDTLGP